MARERRRLMFTRPTDHPQTCECGGTGIVQRAGFSIACTKMRERMKELADLQLEAEEAAAKRAEEHARIGMRRRLFEVVLGSLARISANDEFIARKAYDLATAAEQVWWKREWIEKNETASTP
jgi:hypothetical protein